MAGQFPFRLSPSGPFTQQTNDAALGGAGFVRSGFFADSFVQDDETQSAEQELASPIPCQPGATAIFEVELLGYGEYAGTASGSASAYQLIVSLKDDAGNLHPSGSRVVPNQSGSGYSAPSRNTLIEVNNAVSVDSVVVTAIPNADIGSRTTTFDAASGLEYTVARIA